MRAERAFLAPALLVAAACAGAVELGTLFHSPEERARLDRLRRGEPAVSTPTSAAAPVLPPAPPPEVTGFVRRSDGRNTLWIDGRAVATTNPRNTPLFDPRLVRDMAPDPNAAVKVVPESRQPPPKP